MRVRILLGDPDSQVVADRGVDEGVGDATVAKVRNALALYRPLRSVEGVEFRFHRTVLYNSIYLADDQVLVNTPWPFLSPARIPRLCPVRSGPFVSRVLAVTRPPRG